MKRLIVFCIIVLAGCGQARPPNPIPLKQDTDSTASCEDFAEEYRFNTRLAGDKIAANRSDDTQELLYGAQPIWGRYDAQNANGTEGNALLDRNAYIKGLAEAKECGISDWPAQPTRYGRRAKRAS